MWVTFVLSARKYYVLNEMSDVNNIAQMQMTSRMIELLKAYILTYRRAKNYQAIFLTITIVIPLIGIFALSSYPQAKPYLAMIALFFSAFDVLFFDPWQRSRLKTAAKLQEEFDCSVLDIERNTFLVGNKVDHEEIKEIVSRRMAKGDQQRLDNWYPTVVGQLPLPLARLACQRTNLWYDLGLRNTYRRCLLAFLMLLMLVMSIYSITTDPKVTSFVLSVLVPLTPLIIWTLREYVRHGDTIALVTRLKGEIEKTWDVSTSGATPETMNAYSRKLQDAIFSHRASSPLIFDWIYFLKRRKMEPQMNDGAQQWVNDLIEASRTA